MPLLVPQIFRKVFWVFVFEENHGKGYILYWSQGQKQKLINSHKTEEDNKMQWRLEVGVKYEQEMYMPHTFVEISVWVLDSA